MDNVSTPGNCNINMMELESGRMLLMRMSGLLERNASAHDHSYLVDERHPSTALSRIPRYLRRIIARCTQRPSMLALVASDTWKGCILPRGWCASSHPRRC